MKNVFKGFQASHLAVPKIHAASINSGFKATHALGLKKPTLRMESTVKVAKTAKPVTNKKTRMPGKGSGKVSL